MFPFPFSFFGAAAEPPELELIDNNFAIEFDAGSSEYISAGNPTELQITGDITISAWFKTTSTNFGSIIDKGYYYVNGSLSYRLYLRGSGQGVGFDYYGGNTLGTRVYAQYTVAQNDGQWHHLVGVKSGSSSILYLDGAQVATGVGNQAAINNSSENFTIGASSNNTSNFDGDIDEVAVWNRALQLDDIQRIYNATNDNPGKTANLWSAGLNTGLVYWNRMGD